LAWRIFGRVRTDADRCAVKLKLAGDRCAGDTGGQEFLDGGVVLAGADG
jgi:hypothetical protein